MNSIYLIYGLEYYLIKKELENIKAKYNTYDYVYYDMLESNISDALEDALMGSLFSSNKLIVCDNSIFLTGSKCEIEHNTDDLLKYMNMDSDNVLVLLVNSDSIDNRKKIVKELNSKHTVLKFDKLKGYDLNNFIKKYCTDNGYKIDNDAINLFLKKLNDNLFVITTELDKLFTYISDNKSINKSDVEVCTSKFINNNIFDLIDAIVKSDVDKIMEVYDDMLILNEDEVKIIITLANQFRLIYQVKTMYKSGFSEFDIAKSLDIHPYRIKLANQSVVSESDALLYLKKLAIIDKSIKTGKIDKRIAFERFILNN